MPNLSSILANTYQLPQQQAQRPVQQAAAPFQDDIGDALTGLKQTDGITEDYYNKWSKLKGFAKDAWENYGVDVRYNDPSVPESARLNRIYLKAIADLKGQGNRLKNNQAEFMQDRAHGYLVEDQNTGYYDTKKIGGEIDTQKLDPIVSEANKKLQQQFYGDSIKEALIYYEEVKDSLEKRKAANPDQANYWQRQIEQLIKPTQAEKVFQPLAPPRDTAADKTDARRLESAKRSMEYRANRISGLSDDYVLSETIFTPEGNRVLTAPGEKGETYGGLPVERWEFVPETGESMLVTKKDDQVIKTPMYIKNLVPHMQQVTSENRGFDIPGEYFVRAAEELGIFDTSGSGQTDPTPLLRKDRADVYAKQKALIDKSNGGLNRQKIKEQLAALEGGLIWDDETVFKDKDGTAIKVRVIEDNGSKMYDVRNAKDVIKLRKGQTLKDVKIKSPAEMLKFLVERGVRLEGTGKEIPTPAKKTTTAQPGTKTAAPTGKKVKLTTLQGLLGTPGYEGQTEETLRKYYEDNGYTIN